MRGVVLSTGSHQVFVPLLTRLVLVRSAHFHTHIVCGWCFGLPFNPHYPIKLSAS